ncbi:MAG: TonB family protein [Bacteroidales bacterium]|nr:TonB family protein [Bacteroidales bacterium]
MLMCLCTIIITSCNSNKIDREKLSAALLKYDSFSNFSDGVAFVNSGGKYGLINLSGKEIVPCKYECDEISLFSDGVAIILNDANKWGFIDKKGSEIIYVPNVLKISRFSEDLATITRDVQGRWKYGFIDKTGKEVISCIYDQAFNFSEGLACVRREGKFGFIDKTGKEVIPCIYDDAHSFSEGLARVAIDNLRYGFIDKTGKGVVPFVYTDVRSFSDGLALVGEKGKYGFIDKEGKEIIPKIYEYGFDGITAYPFSENLAVIQKKYKCGFIDKTGREVIPCIYDNAYGFSEGLAQVVKNGKYGFVDKTGKEVIPCILDNANAFNGGLTIVEWNDQVGFIDREGYFIGKGIVKHVLELDANNIQEYSYSEEEDVSPISDLDIVEPEIYEDDTFDEPSLEDIRIPHIEPEDYDYEENEGVEIEAPTYDNQIYEKVDIMPQFSGGEKEMMKFIAQNLKYPAIAIENGIQGTVKVRFIVNRDGTISDITITKSLDSYLDREAIRVIKSMPKWIAGKQNGQNVAVYYTLPINFRLE